MSNADTKKIDLHSHTTASDGGLSPTDLVRKAVSVGIGTLAITDHDTVDGLPEAMQAAQERGVRVIPGVEFGIEMKGTEVHMLGYFLDTENPALLAKLSELREGRLHRGRRMVERLAALGLDISWERVDEIAAGSVGRPHIARAMIERGHVATIDEAFEKYLARGRPAYIPRANLTMEECIALIHHADGVAVLAHPTYVNDLESVLPRLVDAGLDGIETYYGRYTQDTIARIEALARKYGLLRTGGSDYHGLGEGSHADLGSVNVPPECLVELEQRARDRKSGVRA